MLIYYSFQNTRVYKSLQRFWRRESICQCLSEPSCTALLICLHFSSVQEYQACNKFHTFTAWTCSCHDLWEDYTNQTYTHKQPSNVCNSAKSLRWDAPVSSQFRTRRRDALINMLCTWSTEDAMQPVLRGATNNRTWKYAASSSRYLASLCIKAHSLLAQRPPYLLLLTKWICSYIPRFSPATKQAEKLSNRIFFPSDQISVMLSLMSG